ncbi:hypothetical protein D3C86_1653520 [compost metagenome]
MRPVNRVFFKKLQRAVESGFLSAVNQWNAVHQKGKNCSRFQRFSKIIILIAFPRILVVIVDEVHSDSGFWENGNVFGDVSFG